MRGHAYHLFEIVAWPALVWGSFEVAVRMALGETGGLANALLITSCAAGCIAASRMRMAAIAVTHNSD
jgi:hypothetical protein